MRLFIGFIFGLALSAAVAQDVRVTPGIPQTLGSTVATLPSCTAALAGTIRYVTDALAPAIGVTVAGAGAVSVIVVCNGTAWIAG